MDGREKLPEKLPGCVVPPQGGRAVPTVLLIELLEAALHPVDLRDAPRDFRDALSPSWSTTRDPVPQPTSAALVQIQLLPCDPSSAFPGVG